MRQKVTVETLKQFMHELAAASQTPGKVYLTGGATALLLGFREQTIDIDLKLDPEPRGTFEAIAALKNRLHINVELASPGDFIPAPADWRQRSRPITAIGSVEFFHYDFSLQALSKLERGYTHDLEDAVSLIRGGYTNPSELRNRFAEMERDLVRFPAIDPEHFKNKVEDFLRRVEKEP